LSERARSCEFDRTLNVSPERAYYAFTNTAAVGEWFCNGMEADVSEDGHLHCGRLYFWWNDGFYVSGEFTALKENEAIELTWNGRGDPGPTVVSVSFEWDGEGTRLRLKHSGFRSGDDWDALMERIKARWEEGLENLASVLETGIDLREARRPIMGFVSPGPITEENAVRYNLSQDTRGMIVGSVVPGRGAEAAGLQSNDVLHSLNGVVADGSARYRQALAGKRAGDTVEVVYSRGGVQHTTHMELSAVALPDVPTTARELSEATKQIYARIDADLDEILNGVSEAEASHRPAAGEWSAKDVLGHLIDSERYQIITWISVLVSGWDTIIRPANAQARLEALLVVYPTLDDLRAELSRSHRETVELLARLPEAFMERKSTYWRVGQVVLQAMHPRLHCAQIREAIVAARQKA
jgi:uncharacterized protein YndB with AHSA1/START domain